MEELLNQIKQSKEFAELGPNITEDQLRNLINQYTKQPEGKLDEEGGIVVTPNKGYVIKTVDSITSEKVFLNICSHELIDAPEEQEIPNVDDHVGLRVPLSLGNPKSEFDKSNKYIEKNICRVYDVIVNPSVLQRSQDEAQTRQLLVELIVSHIAQKYKQELSLSNFYFRVSIFTLKIQRNKCPTTAN